MYTLTHDGESVGNTKLERGDPSSYSVSGEFNNVGGPIALAGWIKSVGGNEDNGVVYIVLNNDFSLLDQGGKEVKFEEGTLISVPSEDEVFLEITGVSEEDYNTNFSEHLSALSS